MTKVSFNNKNANFFKSINEEVDAYFKTNNILKTGNAKLYLKTIILISSALAIYLFVLFSSLSVPIIIGLGLLLGFVCACIGFNVMHDANHGSYSSRKGVNTILSLTMNALGGNSYIWKFKHNIIHHTYPNIDGVDDDIANSPFIRMCDTQRWLPAHRVQHLYTPILYSVSSFYWVLVQDYEKYFWHKLNDVAMVSRMPLKEHVIFWISKLLYLFFYVLLPLMLLGWFHWLIFFIALHAALGFTLSVVFQLAHVVEPTHFEHAPRGDLMRIEKEWAVHQVRTTADFSPAHPVITWLVGGLNYQVEHHLFPRISHVHYPALSKIVRRKCEEFNLPYNCIPTFRQALLSHFTFIRMMGRK